MKIFDSFKHDIQEVGNIMLQHGCDLIEEKSKIYFAHKPSSPYDYKLITKDGVYTYQEVYENGFVLKKRLTCYDMSSSFLIVCADIAFFMQYTELFDKQEYDYQRIKRILSNNVPLIMKTIPLSNQLNPLLKKYFRVIHE